MQYKIKDDAENDLGNWRFRQTHFTRFIPFHNWRTALPYEDTESKVCTLPTSLHVADIHVATLQDIKKKKLVSLALFATDQYVFW